jgi:HPt (histidine-containing phosphotransfer) domain-containing protein
MDHFLAKPIQIEDIERVIQKFSSPSPKIAQEKQSGEPGEKIRLDTTTLSKLRALTEKGEPDFLNELIDDFLVTAPVTLAALRTAIEKKEARGTEQLSHRLKGTCRNLGLKKLAGFFEALEKRGAQSNFSDIEGLLKEAEEEFHTTCSLLQKDWKLAA